ncbi:dolichol-phosphate mannosyltransferase subunit 3-like [Convolutriloba macropyga]|uniref:dolichol-phosphate mannosyltransferase subunit 3-like n=1 Tax=Convolutriloba macropyga TaxID=536237 RepID=UPI003F52436F
MTKLMQWFLTLVAGVSVWILLLTMLPTDIVYSSSASTIDSIISLCIRFLPIVAIVLFGLYSLAVIGYRVASFNDCQKESDALKLEVEAAKKSLLAKGYKF